MIRKSFNLDKYKNAIHRSAVATGDYLTHQLRADAAAHGWNIPSEALSVKYDGSKLNVNVHQDHIEAAHVLEYGNERQRPTAVIRKLSNNTDSANNFLVQHLRDGLGKKL